jgi:hypothetical protein
MAAPRGQPARHSGLPLYRCAAVVQCAGQSQCCPPPTHTHNHHLHYHLPFPGLLQNALTPDGGARPGRMFIIATSSPSDTEALSVARFCRRMSSVPQCNWSMLRQAWVEVCVRAARALHRLGGSCGVKGRYSSS